MISSADIVEIQLLLALYGHVADSIVEGGSPERFREVFAPDAFIDRRGAGGVLHQGIDSIMDLFVGHDAPHPPSHHGTNAYVWQEGEVVCAASKWLTIEPATGGLRSGDYNDRFVRLPVGWRIAQRVVKVRWWDGPVNLTLQS